MTGQPRPRLHVPTAGERPTAGTTDGEFGCGSYPRGRMDEARGGEGGGGGGGGGGGAADSHGGSPTAPTLMSFRVCSLCVLGGGGGS